MDQEKFDQHLMGYLFDELDEVTCAAMKRALGTDANYRQLEAGLRATIEVAQLPIEQPSKALKERILKATEHAQATEPWHAKLMRSVLWAGSHAMRPQLAMASLLLLVVGSSVLLLRARPSAVSDVVATRTEDGAASRQKNKEKKAAGKLTDRHDLRDDGARSATADVAGEEQMSVGQRTANRAIDNQFARGMANYRAEKFKEAQHDFSSVASTEHRQAPSAALYEARSVRSFSGCSDAVRYYQTVRKRFRATGIAADAAWEQADCHMRLSQKRQARQIWRDLKRDKHYRERASNELAGSDKAGNARTGAGSSGVAAAKNARRSARPRAKPKARATGKAQPHKPAKTGQKPGKWAAPPATTTDKRKAL